MSAKSPGAALALAVMFCLPLIGLFVQHSEPNNCEHRDCPRREAVAAVASEHHEEKTKQVGETDFAFGKLTDWLLVVITGLLALYTQRLYQATANLFGATKGLEVAAKKQGEDMAKSIRIAAIAADAARKSTDLARQEFLATHRPRITVRQMRAIFPDGNLLAVAYKIVNTGESTATIETHQLNVMINPKEDKGKHVMRNLDFAVLASGEHHDCLIKFGSDEYAAAFSVHGGTIRIQGNVVYRDDLNIRRETGFLRTCGDGKHRFVRSEDPDEEYED